MKTISFAIPCYNSAEYMDKCIESILACGGAQGTDDIEIIIVDDGSVKDNTAERPMSGRRATPASSRRCTRKTADTARR